MNDFCKNRTPDIMKRFFSCILFFVATALSLTAHAQEPVHRARPETGAQIMKILYKFRASAGAIRSYGEVSEAIAKASTEDPLFPSIAEGSEMTAAILVALAWHESAFVPSVVGDNGRSFGLYQIQPGTAAVKSNLLTLPKTASFIAVDLIRRSVKHCLAKKRDWREGLAWYAASSEYGSAHPKIITQSRIRMEKAAELFLEFFAAEVPFGRLLSQK